MKKLIQTALLLTLLPVTVPLLSQQVSEAEVSLQRTFIEAKREMQLGNNEEAIELFEKVLKKDRRNHAAYFELARLEMRNDAPNRAIRHIRNAVNYSPDNSWYARFEAEILESLGRYEEAADAWEQLVKGSPDEPTYYRQWALNLIKLEKVEPAIQVFDRMEKAVGPSEELIRRKVRLYLGIGNTRKAEQEMLKLVQYFPTVIEYRYALAEFYEQLDREKDAREVYEGILALDPSESKARLRLAGGKRPSEDEQRFLASLAPIFQDANLEIDPKIKRVIPLIQKVADSGDSLLANGLLQLMEVLKTTHPGDAKPYAASGDLLLYTGRAEKALENYLQALSFDESVFSVWDQTLAIYAARFDYQRVSEVANDALDLFPNQARLYIWLARADIFLSRPDRAQRALEQAELMSSSNPALLLEVYYWQGQLESRNENWEAATAAFEKAAAIQPADPLVLSAWSLAISEQDIDPRKAMEMAERSLEIRPGLPQGLHAKAWQLYRREEFAAAAELLQQANRITNEGDPRLLEHLGDVLFQLGQTEQAIELWEKARRQGSSSKLLERKITDRKLYE